ncbi:DNA-binding protein WhiA [Oscillospiraceae bacterium 42-9]|jgi:DNA-binding protein WhiA|uniref:DNA-binding protein WhiA n=1 Tax=Acutalibacter sp. TaxID=1918636 RepID=UPI00216E671E|nr:DNA-binding protein WhiA [Acutalibacter sp.]
MSFTSQIKMELAKTEPRRFCCLGAQCYGAWLFSKCFTLQEGAFVTENPAAARRMLELAAAGAGVSAQMRYAVSRRNRPAYRVTLPERQERRQLLEAFGHTGQELCLRINRAVLEDECCPEAFLRGAFLTCGSATDPNKFYHLEFTVPFKNLAWDLYTLLGEAGGLGIAPAVVQRTGSWGVYLKDSGQIEDLLTYMGATGASMELMQVRMYKEAKNNINRKSNFETANMDKTYSASARQTAAIAAISDSQGLDSLPEHLRELARLRLDNPEMTLRELGERLGVSRSGVNHRLQKLLAMGEALLEEKGVEGFM